MTSEYKNDAKEESLRLLHAEAMATASGASANDLDTTLDPADLELAAARNRRDEGGLSALRCRKFRRPYLIEPVLLCLHLAYGALLTLNAQYLFRRLVRGRIPLPDGLVYGFGVAVCADNSSRKTLDTVEKLQAEAGLWEAACIIARLAPPLVLSNSIIDYTQKVGRKFGLLLASIGGSIAMAVYLLGDFYHLWLGYNVLALFIFGLTGGFFVPLACSYIYVMDRVPAPARAFRYAILSGVNFLAFALASFGIGAIVDYYDYSGAITAIFLALLLAVIYIIILLPESLPQALRLPDAEPLPTLYIPTLINTFRRGAELLRVPREAAGTRPTLRLVAAVAALDACLLSCTSEAAILFFLGPPVCLSASEVSFARSLQVILAVVGPLLGSRFYYRRYPEPLAGMLACLSGGVGLIVVGCARSGILVLVGQCLQFFAALNNNVYRSMINKLVDPEEKGVAQQAVSSLQSSGGLVGTVLTLLLFSATASSNSGAIFIFYGALYLVATCLYGAIYWFQFLSKEITQPLANLRPL